GTDGGEGWCHVRLAQAGGDSSSGCPAEESGCGHGVTPGSQYASHIVPLAASHFILANRPAGCPRHEAVHNIGGIDGRIQGDGEGFHWAPVAANRGRNRSCACRLSSSMVLAASRLVLDMR